MEAVVTTKDKLESDITDLLTDVYEIFSDIQDDDIEESLNALEVYIKYTTRIGLRIHKSGYIILQDCCLVFQDILNHRREQQRALSRAEREQLELWPTLLLSHITDPDNPEHIEQISAFVENPLWTETTKEQTCDSELCDNNIIDTNPSQDEVVLIDEDGYSHQELFDTVLYETIQQEILESTSDLITDLLQSPENNDDIDYASPLNLCAERIEALAMSMSSMGYMGIMDACMYFQLGLRSLAENAIPPDEKVIESIEEWPGMILAYFASPDESTGKDLVDFLVSTQWIPPLTDMDVETLRSLLIPENIEFSASPEDQFDKNDVLVEEDSDNITSQADEDISLMVEDVSDDRMDFLADELVNLVIEEISLEKDNLTILLSQLRANNEKDITNQALADYKNTVDRFLLAIESIGLNGLLAVFSHLNENIEHWINAQQRPADDCLDFIEQWPELTNDYLYDLSSEATTQRLVDALYKPDWPVSPALEKKELFEQLFSPSITIEDESEQRAKTATAEDVSLQLPDDVNQQLLNSLLHELPVQTSEFTAAISKLVDGTANNQDIEQAQRIAHTLKGAANTVGVAGIANLTHHLEDILTAFTKHNILPGSTLAEVLIDAADVLEMMSEALAGMGEVPEQALTVLQKVLDWANTIDQQGIPENDATALPTPDNTSTNTESTTESSETSANAEDNMVETMLRVPAKLMDELLRLAGENIILGAQLKEHLNQAEKNNEQAHEHNTHVQQLIFELEQIVDIQRMSSAQSQSELTNVFDALELEQYNELHSLTHQLVEASTDAKELTRNIADELNMLNGLLADQERLQNDNQDLVMQTRMVPIQNIIPRLQRSIRQTCRYTGKKVNLNISGADTLIDSDVLNDLAEPLMHILRNAIDHGVEVAGVRRDKNKPEDGNINLEFRRDGDHIVISCKDDGKGLDHEAIRNTAIEKGILETNSVISTEELQRLIWLPGFSTSKAATQVSGRGIGMDAVFNRINAIKGSLKIDSEKDKGCTVEIRLPLTLISVHAILIKNHEQTVAISNRGFEQILNVSDGKLVTEDYELYFEHNDTRYHVYDIENLLYQPALNNKEQREQRSIILLRDETGHNYAITVELVISNEDLVVKQLGQYVPDISGIEGATVLGNGNIVPVLDLPGLIRTISDSGYSPAFDLDNFAEEKNTGKKINALVVDDSLSARRSLAEFIEDIGYQVSTARDGIEAIEVINENKPDILLVDLEMPRMNGLELTSHLRSGASTKDIPIIMVTSRSTEKHREMAFAMGIDAYVTKPFSEGELFDQIDNLLTNKSPA